MRLRGAVLSLTEQLCASGFTFFLFFAASRLLTGAELALYTTLFSLYQSFAFFLSGLVLLPVSSAASKDAQRELGISLVLLLWLLGMFAIIAPLAMRFFGSFQGRIGVGYWALAVAFFSAECGYQTARWLTIRLRGPSAALKITLARFILFFGTVLALGTGSLNAVHFALIQVGTDLVGMLGYGALLRRYAGQVRLTMPDRSALKHMATLGNSVAAFLTNFTVVTMVDRGLGGGGLAAYQAIRSATNPVGLLSQVFDNHFSAELARTGRRLKLSSMALPVTVLGAVVLLGVATVFGPQITAMLFAGRFAEYSTLVPLLFTASLTHALTRPVFVSWRIEGDTIALNLYSAGLLLGALPLLFITGIMRLSYAMVGIFALMPLLAIALNMTRRVPDESGR